jgi:F-type H+-transporting ATPase subunit delta
MREAVRGFAQARAEDAESAGRLPAHAEDLAQVAAVVEAREELALALGDPSIDLETRRGIVDDLFRDRIGGEALDVVRFTLAVEPAALVVASLADVAARTGALAGGAAPGEVDLPAGPVGGRERLCGYALAATAQAAAGELDDAEDATFRLARLIEAHGDLAEALGSPTLPAPVRIGIVEDLLSGQVGPLGLRLARRAVSDASRRDLVERLDLVVAVVAAERGRRIALVRVAVPLGADLAEDLRRSLSERVGRPVELRVRVDAGLLGGMVAVVGELLFDSSVRHRLEIARDVLAAGSILTARAGAGALGGGSGEATGTDGGGEPGPGGLVEGDEHMDTRAGGSTGERPDESPGEAERGQDA